MHISETTSYFASIGTLRHLHATSIIDETGNSEETRHESADDYSNGEVEPIDSWEEEDEAEPEVGDGGDGALSIAREVLLEFGEDMELYVLKTSPRGYIYVRLDKLSNEYGCPSMEEIESFSRKYKKKLDEIGATVEIPDDLALEVSSPGADRLLRVPHDLLRSKDVPMVVSRLEDSNSGIPEKNRRSSAKGRPLSRKQKDSRLRLPYSMIKRVNLYISY
ncbi:hypothetical protein CDL12_29453 [Handroanthus impetiginosus]|uniref:Uncharacterized protein n=1 Tax=Handroanthus impetiginosus TaxID=429701 RepID=A0A2G9FYD7_9LAMI|nr:hypothetical protein CDL12_29453 [Handroanthus impetiginosus]